MSRQPLIRCFGALCAMAVALTPAYAAAESGGDLSVSSAEYALAGSSLLGVHASLAAFASEAYDLGLLSKETYARFTYAGTSDAEADECFKKLYPGEEYPHFARRLSAGADAPSTPDPRLSLIDADGSIKPCSPVALDGITAYRINDDVESEILQSLSLSS